MLAIAPAERNTPMVGNTPAEGDGSSRRLKPAARIVGKLVKRGARIAPRICSAEVLVEQLAGLSAWGTFSSLPAAAHKAQAVKAVLEILAQMAKE